MPIYEFYCPECHAIFNFLARTPAKGRKPTCPRCRKDILVKQVSSFAMGSADSTRDDNAIDGLPDIPVDEHKLEQAVSELAGHAGTLDENDPRQVAGLMRKFSRMTGMEFGEGMQDVLSRLEQGENPENLESAMEGLDESDIFAGQASGTRERNRHPPEHDEKLYEM